MTKWVVSAMDHAKPTPAEELLWWHLRGNQSRFPRRQESITPVIAGFAYRSAHLVLETDAPPRAA